MTCDSCLVAEGHAHSAPYPCGARLCRSEEELAEAEGGEGEGPFPPLRWAGCILLSPMLRIKEDMRPHWLLVTLLQGLVYLIPDAPIVPTPDTIRY